MKATVRTLCFAIGHPEKIVDFGYRAVHEMTVQAKAIIAAYYGTGPRLSYWNSCSTGGRQGLMEAQRFPLDYNGIAAGAPPPTGPICCSPSIWIAKATLVDPASYVPPSKYPADPCGGAPNLRYSRRDRRRHHQ